MDKNIVWHDMDIGRERIARTKGHRPALLWFTGLSGSGKSTIASKLHERLIEEGKHSYVLDGDNVRHGLNSDLGFSEEHREENIRRIGEVGKLFVDAGMITITSFISPYKKDRDDVRKKLGNDFVEVFVKCNIDECEKRDPKGLYKKARQGLIKNFTGVSDPYEEPEKPEIVVDTSKLDKKGALDVIYNYLIDKKII